MSRLLWWDASAGAAGDMLLASLLDAGADADWVRARLADILGETGWKLDVTVGSRSGMRALRLEVLDQPRFVQISAEAPRRRSPHPHRPWREVRALLAGLPGRAGQRAQQVYGKLAAAEARIHGVPVEEVELHEVGALDSIADIAGTCLALESLGIDEIWATPLPMGVGHVMGAHGRIPLPAPATLAVLEGWPVVPALAPGEWVTPTGAALIAGLARPGPLPAMRLGKIGVGAGRKDPEAFANVVRAVLGRVEPAANRDSVVQIACQVDDSTGELIAPALALCLEAGALDALAIPVWMKKGRPGVQIQVLARPADADRLGALLLRHTSTLGVRHTPASRQLLERWERTVETPWGPVRIKIGGLQGEVWHGSPEFEDIDQVARAHAVPHAEVYQAALRAWDGGRAHSLI